MADPQIWTDTGVAGPASYSAANGIVVTTTLASVAFFVVEVDVAGATLGQADFDVTLNAPAAGQVRLRPKARAYDKLTAAGLLSGLGAGVTARATSGGTVDVVSHLHTLTHDHAISPASTGPAGGAGDTLVLATGVNLSTHTHTVDLPSHVGNTGAEAAHTHIWDNLYAHIHGITNTATDLAPTEIADTVDLSGSTFNYLATA